MTPSCNILLTAILHIAHLIGITAAQHLLHKPIIVAGVVVRMSLFEDAPMPPGFDSHQVVPSKGSWLFQLLRVKCL